MKRRRIVFFLLWILSLVGITFFGGTISYGLFWTMTFIPILSLFYLLMVFVQFRVYQEIESRTVVSKQPTPYYFVLPNETFYSFASLSIRLFSGFSYVSDMPEDEEYELLPGDNYTYRTKLVCKYRGEYEVGVKEIIITDFFKLFRFKYRVQGTIKAQVFPRIVHKQELESMKDIVNMSFLNAPFQQIEPDVVTREYIPGDSMKYIHWKVSAREQKLKTRLQEGERKQELLLLYDTKRYSREEAEYIPLESQILETVLALGYHFTEKGIPYTVLWGEKGVQQYKVHAISQLDYWYQRTAGVGFGEEEDMAVLVQHLLSAGLQMNVNTLIMVVHDIEDKLMNILQQLTFQGYSVMLYLITDKEPDKYIRYCNDRLKMVILPIEGNLEELL